MGEEVKSLLVEYAEKAMKDYEYLYRFRLKVRDDSDSEDASNLGKSEKSGLWSRGRWTWLVPAVVAGFIWTIWLL